MIEIELLQLVGKVKAMKTEFQMMKSKATNTGCPRRLYDTISAFSNRIPTGSYYLGWMKARAMSPSAV